MDSEARPSSRSLGQLNITVTTVQKPVKTVVHQYWRHISNGRLAVRHAGMNSADRVEGGAARETG